MKHACLGLSAATMLLTDALDIALSKATLAKKEDYTRSCPTCDKSDGMRSLRTPHCPCPTYMSIWGMDRSPLHWEPVRFPANATVTKTLEKGTPITSYSCTGRHA